MSKEAANFVETLEYRRFAEFCRACGRYRYIGLCYGRSGVGKTLSARQYSGWDDVENGPPPHQLSDEQLSPPTRWASVFYTVPVVNAPRQVEADVLRGLQRLQTFAEEPLRREEAAQLAELHTGFEAGRREFMETQDWLTTAFPAPARPAYADAARAYTQKRKALAAAPRLVVIDEADRLTMPSLEQLRDLFDRTGYGLILMGMPGLEKRLSRYAQFYSRIGFVHEFRPLSADQVRALLKQRWTPPGVALPTTDPLAEEAVAAVIRVTGGNFRLLHRLLTQMERILEINQLPRVTPAVVEAARESLVIGSG